MAETFEVSVGKECKIFLVHKHTTVRRASFFKAALSRDWQEAREKRVSLPNCAPETFEGYLQYLYTNEVTVCGEESQHACELVKMWVLADFLGDYLFAQAVCHTLYTRNPHITLDAVELIYELTSYNSALRPSVFGLWMSTPITRVLSSLRTEPGYPQEFILDLIDYLVQAGRVVDKFPRPQVTPAQSIPELSEADDEDE
jgi:hypothetical protein